MDEIKRPDAGLYIHIPFCRKKCLYCDFYSKIPVGDEMDRFAQAFAGECRLQSQLEYGAFLYDTIFLGGGTPSLLSEKHITSIFDAIRSNFNIAPNPEITIEINPSSVTENRLNCYRDLGINRLSLGIQSFDEKNLRRLGRLHDNKGAIDSFELIRRAGFNNVSIDLIYGLPDQTLRDWENDLAQAVKLGPEHISAYNLIIEPDTHFGLLYDMGKLRLPLEEVQDMMYHSLISHLSESGYARYELSNFAKPGFACQHNLKYWHLEPYLGLGPAAVSFDGVTRSRNISDLSRYIDAIDKGILPPSETEALDSSKLREEVVMMSLRLSEGLATDHIKQRFGYDLMSEKALIIQSLIHGGYLAFDSGHLMLTPEALFISDEVIVKLI